MKKCSLAVLLLFLATTSYSQYVQNVIKLNAVPLFSGVYEIQYEYVFDDANSIQVGIGYGGKRKTSVEDFQEFFLDNFGRNLNGPKDTELKERTIIANVDYRFYFMDDQEAPKGLYLSPSVQYLNYRETYYALERESFGDVNGNFAYSPRTDEKSFNGVNVRALVGFQVLIADKIALNPYFGAGLLMGNSKDYIFKNDDDIKGISFNFGANIGFGF